MSKDKEKICSFSDFDATLPFYELTSHCFKNPILNTECIVDLYSTLEEVFESLLITFEMSRIFRAVPRQLCALGHA